MIKAIIFDVGGVTHQEDIYGFFKGLAEKIKVDYKKLEKITRRYHAGATLGKLSADEHVRLIAKKAGIKNFRKLKKEWIRIISSLVKLDKDVEKTIKELKKNYTVGTLTNIVPISHKIRIKKRVYKHFKIRLISCEVGLRKPDIRFYRLLIKKLKLAPEEIVFIDDLKRNIPPAKKLGIKTILFRNNNQLKQDLRKLGVKT